MDIDAWQHSVGVASGPGMFGIQGLSLGTVGLEGDSDFRKI